ncbi:MAG: hypothetical protein FWG84_10220 [Bacteroidales bacterium]|nr:hypothetical protein [Bacteroidales bacterium]
METPKRKFTQSPTFKGMMIVALILLLLIPGAAAIFGPGSVISECAMQILRLLMG